MVETGHQLFVSTSPKKATRFWNGASQRKQDGAEHCTFILVLDSPLLITSITFYEFSRTFPSTRCSRRRGGEGGKEKRRKKNRILSEGGGRWRRRKKKKKWKKFRARREQNLETYRILILLIPKWRYNLWKTCNNTWQHFYYIQHV